MKIFLDNILIRKIQSSECLQKIPILYLDVLESSHCTKDFKHLENLSNPTSCNTRLEA